MDADYPAAHSMDTVWFAVDLDGHVAYFHSSETGVVPVQADADSDARVLERLPEVLPRVEPLHDRRGRCGTRGDVEHCGSVPQVSALLMFLDSPDPIRDELAAGRATEVGSAEGLAFVLRGISEEVYKRIHAAGACRGCFWHWVGSEDSTPEHFGLFEFGHPIWNTLAYPYERRCVPAQPVHVDQLPPDLRRAVKQVVLNLRFGDAQLVQPAELLPCESWEPAYLDCTGTRLRPVPGKEKEYAEAYAELKERYKDRYKVQPPPRTS
jgi:hypothetical protein